MTDWSAGMPLNWTCDAEGRSNSSVAFRNAVDEVARILRRNGAGDCLDVGWARATAGIIVARLAHVHGFGPTAKLEAAMREMRKALRPGESAQDALDTIRDLLASVGF